MYASKTRLAAVLGVALCAASCRTKLKSPPPPPGPPPDSIVVDDQRVVFRGHRNLELHALLAAAARNDTTLPSALEPAREPYARVFASDDRDEAFLDVIRGLDACVDARCNFAPLAEHGLDRVFIQASDHFDAAEWEPRARLVMSAIARVHAAFDEQREAVLLTLAKELGVSWGGDELPGYRARPNVDVVAESPPAGRGALLTPLLAARGPCFAGIADTRQNNTRIADCVVVRALLAGKRPAGFSERFFTVLVVHASAAIFTNHEPKHLSVDRRAIAIAAPDLLEFVTHEWHGGGVTPDLEHRWEAKTRETRETRETSPSNPASDSAPAPPASR